MTDPAEMIEWMDLRISATRTWLNDHGRNAKRPWPEIIIEAKENDIAKFQELRGAYVKALERRNAGAA